MEFSESLKKNRDFQIVYRCGTSLANRYLVMYVLENELKKKSFGNISKQKGRQQCSKTQADQIDKRVLSSE